MLQQMDDDVYLESCLSGLVSKLSNVVDVKACCYPSTHLIN